MYKTTFPQTEKYPCVSVALKCRKCFAITLTYVKIIKKTVLKQ